MSHLKTFWIIFLKDPATGVITGTAFGHNAIADYRNNIYFVGMEKIKIDMDELKP